MTDLIANVAITDTFDEWRIKTNQAIQYLNGELVFPSSNNAPLTIIPGAGQGGVGARGNIFFHLALSNSALDTSTSVLSTAASVNGVFTNASAGFARVNAVYALVNAAYQSSNADYVMSNTSFNRLNVAWDYANSAFFIANTAFANANGTHTYAVYVYDSVNSAMITANNQANTTNSLNLFTRSVSITTNAAYFNSNAVFNWANNINTRVDAANSHLGVLWVYANGVNQNTSSSFRHANTAFNLANNNLQNVTASFNHANSAYLFANNVNTMLYILNADSLSQFALLNAAFTTANSGFTNANTARTHANAAFATLNVAFGLANNNLQNVTAAFAHANSAYLFANGVSATLGVANIHLAAAHAQANVARFTANSAYTRANDAIDLIYLTNANAVVQLNTLQNAYRTANAAYDNSNSAFFTANNRVSSVSGTAGRIQSSGGLTPAIDLATTGAGAATYSSGISAITVDAYGRVVSVSGSANYTTGAPYAPLAGATFTGGVSVPSGLFIRKQNTTNEGGEFTLEKSTNSTLGGNVLIDTVLNTLRIFEGGGSFRGVTLDFAACGSQSQLLHAGNFNAYTPTLTGANASGTWAISITGNAPTATTATNLSGGTVAGTSGTFSLGLAVTGAITQGGNQVLHAGNYNTYAPTKTGTGASGTWAINITGDAATLDGYNPDVNATGSTLVLRDASGHLNANYVFSSYLNMSHASATRTTDNVFFSSNDNYVRKNDAAGMRASLNVPTRTGGDASGSWAINITGTATTATNLNGGSVVATTGSFSTQVSAPIYYDSNNSAYYDDPAATSNFNAMVVNGAATFKGQIGSVSGTYGIGVTNGDSWGGVGWASTNYKSLIMHYGGASTDLRFGRYGNNFGSWEANPFTFQMVDGYAIAVNSWRAPLFYDTDNTGYYVDGAGTSNLNSIAIAGSASFGSTIRQMINLWGTSFGIGVQNSTQYYRSSGRFSWFRGGSHIDTENNAGTGGTVAMTLDASNNLSVTGSIYAQSFVDSNNNGYYVDPSATSNINTLSLANGVVTNLTGTSSSAFGTASTTTEGQLLANYSGQNSAYLYNNASQWGLYSASGGGIINYVRTGNYATLGAAFTVASGSLRAPLFYDQDNTNFYLDPAGNSVLNGSLKVNTSNAAGVGIILSDDGDIVDMNTGYCALRFSSGVQVYSLKSAGTPVITLGSNGVGTATGDWRAPIFYDTNDTGYYSDPNYISRYNQIQPNTIRLPSNTGYYLFADAGNAACRVGWVYADYVQSYNQSYSTIHYDQNNTAYYLDPNYISRLDQVHGNYLYSYGDVRAAGTLYAQNTLVVGEGKTFSTITMADSDNGNRSVHCNSGWIGFLSNAGNWTFRIADDGNVWMGTYGDWLSNQVRSHIYYDNDTAYYANMNETSSFNVLHTYNHYIRPGATLYSDHGGWAGELNKIQWHANNLYIQNRGGGQLLILRNNANVDRFWVDNDGNMTAAGNVTAFSDARLKTNVKTIKNASEMLRNLRGVTFDWINTGKHSVGCIAQEVEAVLPELIEETEKGSVEGDEKMLVKSLDYSKLVSVLIEGWKDHERVIEELRTEVANLKSKIGE